MTDHYDSPTDHTAESMRYLLGDMDADERIEFEARLESGNASQADTTSLIPVLEQLGDLVDRKDPAPGLKDSLMTRIRNVAATDTQPDWVHFNTDDRPWQPSGFEGIEIKLLFVDKVNNRVTKLVRMAAGHSYPAHRHTDVEEVFVLEGELSGSGLTLKAGDYLRSEPNSVHPLQKTIEGCVLWVNSAPFDPIVA